MNSETWRWVLGLIYLVSVAAIWVAASYVTQDLELKGVSSFLITYICNSLFVLYIPLVEISRFLEDRYGGKILFWRKNRDTSLAELREVEESVLLGEEGERDPVVREGVDGKGRWTRARVARVSLVICPFWFLAQLTFNLSLTYTTVTANTILSNSSSLFTFLMALLFLGEKFTWVKLMSVLLCMGGTIIVTLGDSEAGSSFTAPSPALGDILSLLSAVFYAVYITLIRRSIPEDDEKEGRVSMAQLLGFLGLFNLVFFLPVAIVLEFLKADTFSDPTWTQFGLIVGKGLLDNVLSDYLWAKAVLLTTTTVASAGLSIQVPLAAIADSIKGKAPNRTDYIGAVAVMIGFAGITIPSDVLSKPEQPTIELQNQNSRSQVEHLSPISLPQALSCNANPPPTERE